MTRLVVTFLAIAVLENVAWADVPTPPPPKGTKYVSVHNELILDKDIPGCLFVEKSGHGPGPPTFVYTKLALTPGKSATMPSPGRYSYASLYVVPPSVAKEFKTDQELFDALKTHSLKGALHIGFTGTTTVSSKVVGDSVTWTHTITVDANGAIQTTVKKEGDEVPAEKSSNDSSGDFPATKSQPPRRTGPFRSCGSGMGPGLAGIGLAWGITWLGLRFVGRSRKRTAT